MAIGDLFHTVWALVNKCTKRMQRATRRVWSHRSREDRKRRTSEEEEGLWQRTILMGEKCQPLNFSGAIYYDSAGRQLKELPVPRSPLRSPLPSFAFHDAAVHSESWRRTENDQLD